MQTTSRALWPAMVLAIVGVPFAVPAAQIPGGRNPRTDCYARFDVAGAAASSTRVVQCTDGDGSCDADASCNGSCTFRVALCLNQDDWPTCVPPAPASPLKRVVPQGVVKRLALGYPKTATGVRLVATFCIGTTGSSTVDQVAGLPGPGAVVFNGTEEWVKNP